MLGRIYVDIDIDIDRKDDRGNAVLLNGEMGGGYTHVKSFMILRSVEFVSFV